METRSTVKDPFVFLSMLLLIVSNSKWLAQLGIEAYFEYSAYFLLLSGIFLSFIFSRRSRKSIKKNIITFVVVSVLFCVGIAVQGLSVFTRLKLMATMVVLSAAILAEDYIGSMETLRTAAYGILFGTLTTTVMSLFAGVPVMEIVYGGFLSHGFTGGVQYKNYFAAFMLGSFMSLYFYHRYERKLLVDRIVMVLNLLLIFLSSARGTYVFVAVFLIAVYFDKLVALVKHLRLDAAVRRFWKRQTKTQRMAWIAGVTVAAVAGIVIVYFWVVNSDSTYGYRLRGVRNYLRYAWGDWFHLIFGNAEMAWSGAGAHYVQTIQTVVGWDGTYEMGFINTLIKNGIVGIIGFAVMYVHFVRVVMAAKDSRYRLMNLSVLSVLLVSSLVEPFVCNIHSIFGVYCYLMMAGVCGMSRRKLRPGRGVTPIELVRQKWKKRPDDAKE